MQRGHGRAAAKSGASLSSTISILGRMRWLLFVIILLAFGLGPLMTSLDDAQRNYGEVRKSDWAHTNYWLKSADCARATGAWLALCKTTAS
jgi:hypothetical protein